MNRYARIRTMQSCIPPPQKERGVFCHADPERLVLHPPFYSVARQQSFAGQDRGNDADHRKTWFTHFRAFAAGYVANDTIWFLCCPRCIGILRSMPSRQVFPSSANSPVFSLLTSGHSLGACPAPHHPSTHKSCAGDPDSAAHRCSASSPSGLGFQRKNLPTAAALAGEIFSSE